MLLLSSICLLLLSRTDVKPSVSAPVPKPLVVPHNVTDVTGLVDRAFDVLWPSRRDTKSWDAVPLLESSTNSNDVEVQSQSIYQRFVFDMTSQVLSDTLTDRDMSADTSQPWRRQRIAASQQVPQSADEARPLVRASVLQQLGLELSRRPLPRYSGQLRGRRPTDMVDEVLGAELVEEEPFWTDYSDSELHVKMQLSDALFDLMVSDTVDTLSRVIVRKYQQCC